MVFSWPMHRARYFRVSDALYNGEAEYEFLAKALGGAFVPSSPLHPTRIRVTLLLPPGGDVEQVYLLARASSRVNESRGSVPRVRTVSTNAPRSMTIR